MNRSGWLPERRYPFQSHFAQVAGCDVHYVDEGSGPVLLFVHGNPTWSFLNRHNNPATMGFGSDDCDRDAIPAVRRVFAERGVAVEPSAQD